MENQNFQSDFEKKFQEASDCCKRPNILVAGYTGTGKTSLIQTVLGDELVPQSGIGNGKPCSIDFDSYEDDSIRLWDSRGMELGEKEKNFAENMKSFVEECQDDPDVDEHIHLVWYLIQGNGGRVTWTDIQLMKDIFTFDNVIAVISKKDITRQNQFEAIRQKLIESGMPEHRILAVSDLESGSQGCLDLVRLSHQMLPQAYRDAFMDAQSIDREAKLRRIQSKHEQSLELIAEGAEKVLSGEPENTVLPGLLSRLAGLYALRMPAVRKGIADFVADLLSQHRQEFRHCENPEEDAAFFLKALCSYLRGSFAAYATARIQGTALPPLGFDTEQFRTFYEEYKEELSMKPNILVCGKTGVGKTSLIQAVTHRGVVPDSAIGNGEATTLGFQLYETEIANFIDSEGMNPGEQTVDDYADFILNEILERLESSDSSRLIHNIWYCIDGSGARIQDTDIKLLKTLSDKVMLVVTKCELMRKEQTEAIMNTLLDFLPPERIVLVSAEKQTGLVQLIAQARKMSARAMESAEEELGDFQDRWDDYYVNMKNRWRNHASDEADSFINWGAGRAAAIALVPLPLVDVAPLLANEAYMVYKLAEIYGIAVNETVISMLLGCAGGSIAGKIGASFLPFLKVPIAAGVTYGVGQAAKAYFESGMNMDTAELREEFLKNEREAKKRDWKEEAEKIDASDED